MKRPMLVSGITTAITLALIMHFESGAVVISVVTALVLFLCFLFRKNIKKHITIPVVCSVILITLISFFFYNAHSVYPLLRYHKTHQSISGKVISTPENVGGFIQFNIKADKIGTSSTNSKITVLVSSYDTSADLYDYITLTDAYLTLPTTDYGDYDLTQLSEGIPLIAQGSTIEKLWSSPKTPYYYCLKLKEAVSQQISSYMTDDNGALLKGMLFGEKAELSYSTAMSFRSSGISHLLAVSGLHTSLWCGLLIALLSAFKAPPKLKSLLCLIFLALFCIISGFTPSVVRASLMTGISLLAPLFKRTADSFNSLGLSVVILLLQNPYALFSISFQLSVAATAGVLVAGLAENRIYDLTEKITYKPLRSSGYSIASSVLISIMAGIFTLPVCTYYFGVFSLASPISNLLCVQLAFYGMLAGTACVAISFIPIPFVREIYLFLFDVTEFILDIVKEFAHFVSSFRFCTIPMHKDYVHVGIIIALCLSALCYLAYKHTRRVAIIKTTAVICSLIIITSITIPLAVSPHRNTITIASCDNGIQLILRSGLKYAYIENTTSLISDTAIQALPKASCEKLEYYAPTYLSKSSIANLSIIAYQYPPTETMLPRDVYNTARESSCTIPQSAVIASSGVFTLSDEITIEIVDTTGIKYAIIKGSNKTAYVHLYGDTDFSKYVSTDECDIAIYNSKLPRAIPDNVEAVIISANDYDPVELKELSAHCSCVMTTAKQGSIQIQLD